MVSVPYFAKEFLALPSIAVVGISSSHQTVAHAVYRTLRSNVRSVFAVGKNTPSIDNDPCYPDLASLPDPIHGVFMAVRPDRADEVVDHCIAHDVRLVWIHNMGGTVDPRGPYGAVIKKCSDHNITVIPGGCPMMFIDGADVGHKCMRWLLSVTGKLKLRR